MTDVNVQVAVLLQSTGFFVALLLAGFVVGHESVITNLQRSDPSFDKTKPAWKQPENNKRAKQKARDYFPLYWYWGNARAAAAIFVFIVIEDLTLHEISSFALAALVILVGNFLAFHLSKQERWGKAKQ